MSLMVAIAITLQLLLLQVHVLAYIAVLHPAIGYEAMIYYSTGSRSCVVMRSSMMSCTYGYRHRSSSSSSIPATKRMVMMMTTIQSKRSRENFIISSSSSRSLDDRYGGRYLERTGPGMLDHRYSYQCRHHLPSPHMWRQCSKTNSDDVIDDYTNTEGDNMPAIASSSSSPSSSSSGAGLSPQQESTFDANQISDEEMKEVMDLAFGGGHNEELSRKVEQALQDQYDVEVGR